MWISLVQANNKEVSEASRKLPQEEEEEEKEKTSRTVQKLLSIIKTHLQVYEFKDVLLT